MRKYYVSFVWKPSDDDIRFDCDLLYGDPDNMEETIKNWYKELHEKTSNEIEASLTIINWKAL